MADDKSKHPEGSRQNPVVKKSSSQAGAWSGRIRPNASEAKPKDDKK